MITSPDTITITKSVIKSDTAVSGNINVTAAANLTVTYSEFECLDTVGWGVLLSTATAGATFDFQHNLIRNYRQFVFNIAAASAITSDYNIFDASNDQFHVNGVTYTTLALWQAAGYDINSTDGTSASELDFTPTESVIRTGFTLDDILDEMATSHGADSWEGLTAQDVADAVSKLAPTAGAPAAGSMGKHLDDILEDTDTTLPALMAACASVVANNTDSTAAGAITRRRGDSWSIALTLGAITGWTSLWFTVKNDHEDADTAALVQVKLNATGLLDGLLYVNGAAASSDALGSITVSNASTGAIIVAVDETITAQLTPGQYVYDAQVLISGSTSTPDSGTFTVTADVTRSVT
jgi:hypothetical protein